jgi:hypothetical protein
MNSTSEEAAIMYARACRAWYGPNALHIVTSKIEELQRADDLDGVRVWTQIAEQLLRPIDSLKPDFEKRPAALSVRGPKYHVGRRPGSTGTGHA